MPDDLLPDNLPSYARTLVGPGVLGFIKGLHWSFTQYIRQKKESAARTATLKMSQIQNELIHPLLSNTPARRVLVLEIHNGGGDLSPLSPVHVTCLYEDHVFPFVHAEKSDYQSLLVDGEYLTMVSEVIQKGMVELHVDSMKPGCMLRQIYEGRGVGYAQVHYLTTAVKAKTGTASHFILSLASDEPNDPDFQAPLVQAAIYNAKCRLRNELRK